MANPAFEREWRGQRMRAAEPARRARPGPPRSGGYVPTMAVRRSPRGELPISWAALWRGAGASLAIASGYVALVTALRWLLTASL